MSHLKKSSYLSPSFSSGSHFFYTIFTPEEQPVKATILIIHGMREHSGRYHEVAGYFADRGFAVLTYDHPGHGRSVKEKRDMGFFQRDSPAKRLITVAEAMRKSLHQQYPKVPHFVIGHSMGSFITRCLLQKISKKFMGAVIVGTGGPLFGINLLKGYFLLANTIAPRSITFFNNLFDRINNRYFEKDQYFNNTSWLSLSLANRAAFEKDKLCGIPFTNNAFYALFTIRKIATARKWSEPIPKSFPLFFISGKDDFIGDFGKGVKKTVDNMRHDKFTDISYKLYPKMRHEILNEDIKEEVFQEIDTWINKHL